MMNKPSLLVAVATLSLAFGPDAIAFAQSCTATPSALCAVTGDEATCQEQRFSVPAITPISANGCDKLVCNGELACERAVITNTEYVDCSHESSYSCYEAKIDGAKNIKCSSEFSCASAEITNVKIHGHIECAWIRGDEWDPARTVCGEARISSTNPFTLNCQTFGGEYLPSACGFGEQVTNPGGNVFCLGGDETAAGCDDLRIDNSIGCVICGNPEACKSVKIGSTNLPSKRLYVHGTCTDIQVLEYMHRAHLPRGGKPCEDKNNDGVCDVLEMHCANKGNPANCVSSLDFGWSGTVLEGFAAIAPPEEWTTSTKSGTENDTDPESWIWGLVVICVFVILMTITVLYLGHKNGWSWWKNCCSTKKEKTEGPNSMLLEKLKSLDPKDPFLVELDEKLTERASIENTCDSSKGQEIQEDV